MSPPDYLVVGHVTKDLAPGGFRLGGTAFYAAQTAAALGWRVGVVTALEPEAGLELGEAIQVHRLASPVTTGFENIYREGRRLQRVAAVASPLSLEAVPLAWREAAVVHLGPVAGEVPEEMMAAFPQSFMGVSSQGWLRRWDEAGWVGYQRWRPSPEGLETVGAMVLSAEDVAADPEAISWYARRVPVLAVTLGERGCRIYFRGEAEELPAFPVTVGDVTGAGDVFAAAFFIALARGHDPFWAGRFANSAASFLVERGVSGLPTWGQVLGRMEASF